MSEGYLPDWMLAKLCDPGDDSFIEMEVEKNMTYTHEEIIAALTVIRETCKEHDGRCKECALWHVPTETCGLIAFTARNWSLIDEDPKIWRAFT